MNNLSMFIDTHKVNTSWDLKDATNKLLPSDASQAQFEGFMRDEGVKWDELQDVGGVIAYTADEVFVAWMDYENDVGYL